MSGRNKYPTPPSNHPSHFWTHTPHHQVKAGYANPNPIEVKYTTEDIRDIKDHPQLFKIKPLADGRVQVVRGDGNWHVLPKGFLF